MAFALRSVSCTWLAITLVCTTACNGQSGPPVATSSEDSIQPQTAEAPQVTEKEETKLAQATFGGGCFWCVEAVFENLEGVHDVISGYSGGTVKNPTYKQVCSMTTGHAEVCLIKYDPQKIEYKELLEVFWKTHDPTTPNQQGNDIGPQYRSVIYYHDDEQKKLAETYKQKLDESGAFPAKIVTEISEAEEFYEAESYHQDYYRNNPAQGYCMAIVRPKVEKFKKAFADKLIKE